MFPVRVKSLRTKFKMTQQELAEHIGVAKGTISRYESGKKTPSRESVTKLAGLFNVPVDYMLGLSDTHKERSNLEIEMLIIADRIEQMPPDQQKMIRAAIPAMIASLKDE